MDLRFGSVLGGLGGVAGVGAVCVGCWKLSESKNQKEDKPILASLSAPNGSEAIVGQLGLKQGVPDSAEFSNSTCFSEFFNSANVSQQFEPSDENGRFERKTISDKQSLSISAPAGVSTSSGTTGCSLLSLSYNLNPSGYFWSFKGEFALRNEKVGLALWAIGNGSSRSNDNEHATEDTKVFSQYFEYRLVFLEKEKTDNSWKVKGGYQWKDDLLEKGVMDIKIVVPDSVTWIDQKLEGNVGVIVPENVLVNPEKIGLKEYSGKWSLDNQGKGFFEGISVSPSGGQVFLILGSDWNFADKHVKISGGYDLDKNQWVVYKDGQGQPLDSFDAVDVLSSWYKPFKGQKGKWTDSKN